MKKEPFIINIADEALPNLAQDDAQTFGFEYNKTNLWQEDSLEMLRIANSINEKMDIIIQLLKQNGKD